MAACADRKATAEDPCIFDVEAQLGRTALGDIGHFPSPSSICRIYDAERTPQLLHRGRKLSAAVGLLAGFAKVDAFIRRLGGHRPEILGACTGRKDHTQQSVREFWKPARRV